MTSRFFAAGSEPESEEENEIKSEKSEEEEVVKRQFIYESSSDEDTKRVVRSEKDKRYEALRNSIDKIKDKMKIEDFVAMGDEFDELNKQLEKSKKVIEKEGVPQFYIRICYVLENFLTNLSAEKKNSLKPANKKAYNTLKHKVKKNNKNYEEKIKQFGEHPVYSDEESDSEEEAHKKADKKKAQKDDSDEDWKSGSGEDDSDEESEEEEGLSKYLQSSDPMVRRNYWLKREADSDDEKQREKKERNEKKAEKIKRQKEKVEKIFAEDDEKPEKVTKKAYTLDELDKRIVEIVEKRAGRKVSVKEKKVTIEEDLDALQEFFDKVRGDEIKRLEILLILMPTRMDFSRQFSQYCMPRNYWLENFENLQEFFKIIKNKKNDLSQVRTFQKEGDLYYKDNSVVESFATHFDGLDSELYKAFKALESSTLEYVERMKDYSSLIKLADEAYTLFKSLDDNFHSTKFAYKKLECIYYMPDSLLEKLRLSATERNIKGKNEFYQETNTEKTIHELATKVYTSNDNKLIIKTLLYQIYNHAINGRYYLAKEYFLMSHIPEISASLDAGTQILYNRTLVQLGLCAFSLGLIQETVHALSDIISSTKIRELLGQGLSRFANEKEERRRLLPNHMHINIELVESIYLIASVLVEMPALLVDPVEAAKKQRFLAFKRLYDLYKNFYGLPETNRDRIMVAGKELQQGNWRKCYDGLLSTTIWARLTQNAAKAKENLLVKVKEQAFKCYLLTIQNIYDSVNIESIAKDFELDKDYVHSMISKLVFNKEIKAYLDIDSNCLIFEKGDVNKLESKAITLADRVATLLANNEKIMDSKYGSSGITDKDIAENLARKKNPNKNKKLGTILGKDKRKPKPKKI